MPTCAVDPRPPATRPASGKVANRLGDDHRPLVMRHIIDSLILLDGRARFAAAIVAGAVSALALPPFHAFPVLWITLPVIVWLIDGSVAGRDAGFVRRLVPAAVTGWGFGFGYFLAGFWWVGNAFLVVGGPVVALMPLAVVAFAALLAFYWGLAAAVAGLFWSDGPERICIFASVFAVAEWLRGHLFGGLPWNAFGGVLTPNVMLMQSASLVGLWGLTLVAFLVFAAPAALGPATDRSAEMRGRTIFAIAGVLLLAHAGFGAARLALAGAVPDAASADSGSVLVRVVHPGIAQKVGWTASEMADATAGLVALTGAGGAYAEHTGAKVAVWPEAAFPFVLGANAGLLAAIADLQPEGATLVTGAVRRGVGRDGNEHWFNSVLVVDDRGEIVARHDKIRLVPFGEYLPGERLLAQLGLRPFVALPGGFAPGDRMRAIELKGLPPFAASVCYEATFPHGVVPGDNRPSWLVNVTNDGWFAETPGVWQHYQQVRLRAVEQGLPLLRAANNGVSAIIGPYGRAWAMLPPDEIGFADGILPQGLKATGYTHAGGAAFWLLAVFVLGCGVRIGARTT